MLLLERLEDRRLLAAVTEVVDAGPLTIVNGTQHDSRIIAFGSRLTVVDFPSYASSFENLAGDRSDVTDFTLGEAPVTAAFTGNIAGTRGFPPGYNTGAFALITVGQSRIDFATPVDVRFAARDIVELNPAVAGSVQLVGTLRSVTLDVPQSGDPQAGNWQVFDSRLLGIGQITQVVVDNRDTAGQPTGVTNLDDLVFSTVISTAYAIGGAQLIGDLGGGSDVWVNGTSLPSVVRGGDGDDVLFGGGGSDTLIGGSGNDLMYGRGGEDFLFGEAGTDVLVGGAGADVLDGGDGRDVVLADLLDAVFADADDLVLGGPLFPFA